MARLASGWAGRRLQQAVNDTAAVSALSVLAPGSGQKANSHTPALIEDRISLPGRFLLSDPARIAGMHQRDGLSALQIARRLSVSHSAVLAALGKLGVSSGGNGHLFKGQVPFGWDFTGSRLVRNTAGQHVIRLIRQLRGEGTSLNAIARELNRRLVPTKNAGLWQANTVAKILRRLLRISA